MTTNLLGDRVRFTVCDEDGTEVEKVGIVHAVVSIQSNLGTGRPIFYLLVSEVTQSNFSNFHTISSSEATRYGV